MGPEFEYLQRRGARLQIVRLVTVRPVHRHGLRGAVKVRDPLTSELLSTLRPAKPIPQPIRALAYSPDGCSLAALSDTLFTIWDIQTGGVTKQVECDEADGVSLVWSPDGQVVVFILQDWPYGSSYTVRVYNVDQGAIKSIGKLESKVKPYPCAHNKSFRIMTTGWDGQSHTVDIPEVWSVLTKVESYRIGFEGSSVRSFSLATYQISVWYPDRLRIFDVRNQEWSLEQIDDPFLSDCFSHDGSLFAASFPTCIRIWKYASGRYALWKEFRTRAAGPPFFDSRQLYHQSRVGSRLFSRRGVWITPNRCPRPRWQTNRCSFSPRYLRSNWS